MEYLKPLTEHPLADYVFLIFFGIIVGQDTAGQFVKPCYTSSPYSHHLHFNLKHFFLRVTGSKKAFAQKSAHKNITCAICVRDIPPYRILRTLYFLETDLLMS